MSYPGKIQTGSSSALVSHLDIVPTVLGLLDIQTPLLDNIALDGWDIEKHVILGNFYKLSFKDLTSVRHWCLMIQVREETSPIFSHQLSKVLAKFMPLELVSSKHIFIQRAISILQTRILTVWASERWELSLDFLFFKFNCQRNIPRQSCSTLNMIPMRDITWQRITLISFMKSSTWLWRKSLELSMILFGQTPGMETTVSLQFLAVISYVNHFQLVVLADFIIKQSKIKYK